ncbi:MAG: hypothetical protein KC416_12310, partial [Myxococcales bacterium]|nr:hypothetical protein [Myxococcales bacterium]
MLRNGVHVPRVFGALCLSLACACSSGDGAVITADGGPGQGECTPNAESVQPATGTVVGGFPMMVRGICL